jgi:hypothetical protein
MQHLKCLRLAAEASLLPRARPVHASTRALRGPLDLAGFDERITNDAKMASFGRSTQDGLLSKLQAEFTGERINATRRAEDRLRSETEVLATLRKSAEDSATAREAFVVKRKALLALRNELVIQRELSGIVRGTASGVEREFPLPGAL